MNKALVIFGSSRSNGNTRQVVEVVLSDRDVEIVDLSQYSISYYDYENSNINDDFLVIIEKMLAVDTIIFATPVYWYSMSAILKTFFDRLTDLISIRKDLGRELKGKICYLVISGTDGELPLGFEQVFTRTAEYLDMEYKDCFYYPVEKDEIMSTTIKNAAKNWGDAIFKIRK